MTGMTVWTTASPIVPLRRRGRRPGHLRRLVGPAEPQGQPRHLRPPAPLERLQHLLRTHEFGGGAVVLHAGLYLPSARRDAGHQRHHPATRRDLTCTSSCATCPAGRWTRTDGRGAVPAPGRRNRKSRSGSPIPRSPTTARRSTPPVSRSSSLPVRSGGIIVDDGSLEFDETPDGCWAQVNTASATNGRMSTVKPRNTSATCSGQWAFPTGQTTVSTRCMSASLPSKPPARARSTPSATPAEVTRLSSINPSFRTSTTSPMAGSTSADTTSQAREANTSNSRTARRMRPSALPTLTSARMPSDLSFRET
ncbi:MAG: hypothetical protein MZV64_17385 [Ignavibacteriales bacterium]|nr:hypothetical protein [Ignavibacteriales bacterium]